MELIVAEFITVDGVAQAPGAPDEDTERGFEHGGWSVDHMDDHIRLNTELFQTVDAFLIGRGTYDAWVDYWPNVDDETDEIAKALNTKPKYVASTTLEDPQWAGTTVIRNVPTELAQLKEQPGSPILVVGSPKLIQTLTAEALVDIYQLWIHPVVVGGVGKRLFEDGNPLTKLRLVDSRTTGSGLVILTYARA
jgi:dihydrofolate reductase